MLELTDTVLIENAPILFRNFTGREDGPYNREGNRNFVVALDDPDFAAQLERDGWNVKYLKAREEDEAPRACIQITVGYKIRPPRVVMITSRGKTDLGEAEVELLDAVDFETVDVIFQPYNWTAAGKTGVKAYLKSMYATIREDHLDRKYGDIPNANTPHSVEE